MSASMMDTAELPVSTPAALPSLEDISRVDVARSRAARRRERRHLRRQRRLYALGSVALLLSVLGTTIYVVDVVR